MTSDLKISELADPARRPFEIVECKGIGHPDTICDALAEGLSLALSRFYRERFGIILHHNVDKVLLAGGGSRPRYGGGEITAPMEIFFAGRATRHFKGVDVPVEKMATEVAHEFFRRTFGSFDLRRHLKVHCIVRPGSEDLVTLFQRRPSSGVPLANDSSIGVGFAPLSAVERNVLAVDLLLHSDETLRQYPAFGADTKILAVRDGGDVAFTVACAFRDRYVADLADYGKQKAALIELIARTAGGAVAVNAADDLSTGSIYLTVTGTSAESGDDGEAGRGNRANGLITPCRPMTIESIAGKNPVSHIGKVYNLVAQRIAERIVRDLPIAAAECYLVSQIGQPITEPRLGQICIAMRDGSSAADVQPAIGSIVRAELAQIGMPSASPLDRAPY